MVLKPLERNPRLARKLILDEVFDLALYKALLDITDGNLREIVEELVHIETNHVSFWQNFFDLHLTTLDVPRRLKLRLVLLACRLFGSPAIHLVLEALEVYGIRKYLTLWKSYKDEPLGTAVKGILLDEFKHEDAIVTQMAERKINPEKIRNIFLGLNDGLVEILGAVSGFFGAFGNAIMVLIAGSTTAVAGAISMAAGAYVALSSEQEIRAIEGDKNRFLSQAPLSEQAAETPSPEETKPLNSAFVVGGSYFAGAMIPLLPVLFGANDAVFSILTAGTVIILVSMVLAFLSGMNIKKRILTNVIIMAGAVGVTYVIGTIANYFWGVPL